MRQGWSKTTAEFSTSSKTISRLQATQVATHKSSRGKGMKRKGNKKRTKYPSGDKGRIISPVKTLALAGWLTRWSRFIFYWLTPFQRTKRLVCGATTWIPETPRTMLVSVSLKRGNRGAITSTDAQNARNSIGNKRRRLSGEKRPTPGELLS